MIWRWVLTPVLGLLDLVFGGLPDWEVPFVTNPDTGVASQLGKAIRALDSHLPITEMVTLATWVLGYFVPVYVVWKSSMWLYHRIRELIEVLPG